MTLMAGPFSARQHLRRATAKCHQQAEDGFAGLNLTQTNDYRRFLETNAAAIIPLERWAENAGAAETLADWASRKREMALRDDIAALGGSIQTIAPPEIEAGPAELLGVLYVLEGSRLGSHSILKAIGSTHGAVKFLSHGTAERLWPSFVALIDKSLTSRRELDAATGAAIKAFDFFGVAQRRMTMRTMEAANA